MNVSPFTNVGIKFDMETVSLNSLLITDSYNAWYQK